MSHVREVSSVSPSKPSLKEIYSQIEYVARTNKPELFLVNNNLESLPPEIGQLAELKELSVGGNQLVSLPMEICQLANLTRLSIENNKLRSLPSGLAGLKSFKRL